MANNFLTGQPRQQNKGYGNRTSDILRQQLAQSAAQRIAGLEANRFQQQEPQEEIQRPGLFDFAPGIAGDVASKMAERNIQNEQAQREQQQQLEAQDELANIYAAEYDLPIERAKLLASAPAETRKQILTDLNNRRKEERTFENKTAIEGLKFENKKKFADYQKEVDAKFPKDDPNRQWYKQGLVATQKLKKLSKDTPFEPKGWSDKLTFSRTDEENVKNWITMAVAAAAPVAHLNDFQRKELEANYLEQYYKDKPSRQAVIDQLEGTFTASNYEGIQEQAAQMAQRQQQQSPQERTPEAPQEAQQQQMQQQPEAGMEFPESPKEEGWGAWAGRAGTRALGNVAQRLEQANKLTTPSGVASLVAENIPESIKTTAKEYLPEFVTNALSRAATPFNPFQMLSLEELKKNPEVAKILEPQGTLDRVVDSVTREFPEMAVAYGTGGAIVKPLVQGLLGGMSDEWLDSQNVPEVAKVAARIITSFGVSGVSTAIKDLRNKKQPMQYLTKEVRKTASGNYNKARDLGKDIYGGAAPVVTVQEELAIPKNTQNIKDKGAVQGLRDIVNDLFTQGHPEHAPEGTTTVGKVKLNDFTKTYKDLGKLAREETDPAMKEWYEKVKDAIHDSIQLAGNQGGKALESVNTWNAANAGWKATEQLNDFEEIVKKVSTDYPGVAKTVALGGVSALLGFGTYVGPAKALATGAILGSIAGLGSAKRTLSYMKRPEVQKLFLDFMDSGFSKDAAATARNYRDIGIGFKKYAKSK